MIWRVILILIAAICFAIYLFSNTQLFLWWTFVALGFCLFISLMFWAIDVWVKDMQRKGLL